MLNTLLKIGQWQSEGKSELDRFIDKPRVSYFTGKDMPIRNWIAGIVFDLDENKIYIEPATIKEFDEEKDPFDFILLKIQGGNNKAIYPTVELKKIIQLFKTFFGKLKEDEIPKKGELQEVLEKENSNFSNSKFNRILKSIFSLRDEFLEKTLKEGEIEKLDPKRLIEDLDFSSYDNLVFVYACFKSNKFDYPLPKPISQIEDFVQLVHNRFIEENNGSQKKQIEKLCYASGKQLKDVEALNLKSRYNINKMFVTETKNYASLFDTKSFVKNYQLSNNNQGLLDLASSYLLENYKTKIAGLEHVIIPQFLESDKIDLKIVLDKIKAGSELLFSFNALEEIKEDIEIESNSIFWINFLAFESDGNFFKTTNLVKDVSKFHFIKLIQTFREVHWEMHTLQNIVDWDSVMNDYGIIGNLNFNSIYGIIPLRKDKEKKNKALFLFKSVLENRTIELLQIYENFCELTLCHYYERYESYTNVKKYGKDYFDFAIRDAVFKYLAFIQVLSKLKLIDMEQETQALPAEEVVQDFEKRIENFFERMKFNNNQKSMFYLGRILGSVAFMQKGKNKTVIEKVNYHGMDKDDIVRLRKDLFEKAKQYNSLKKIVFNDSSFSQYFNFNDWDMNPQEAVFFLLTGYSFGIVKQENN